MDVILFSRGEWRGNDLVLPTVEIAVNGHRLQDLVRVVERPHAEAEGAPHLAGSYDALTVADIRGRRSHFLGSPHLSWFGDGDTVLLGCDCGEWGCWPLTARVEVDDTTVGWSNFRHGHRDWTYDDLGPFEFSRPEYEQQLDF